MKQSVFDKNLLAKLGPDCFQKIACAKIGIAGAGGLGSNCAVALVRAGFRDFVIADFDKVDVANLDRQAYFEDQVGMKKVEALKINLLRISKNLRMDALDVELEPSNIRQIFSGCDVMVECLDCPQMKSFFVSELLPLGKLLVAASGIGGVGANDEICVHRIKENLVIVGDLKSDVEKSPALAPRVCIAAAKQADVVMEYIVSGKV